MRCDIAYSSTMSKSELKVRIVPDQVESQVCSDASVYQKFLSYQEVQTLVKRALNCDVEVCSYSLQPYSAGQLGFLGSHQRLSVQAKTKRGKETLSFFVKIVPYDVPMQADYVMEKFVFEKEIAFYRDLVPHLYREYKDEPWTSACYLVKENLLVFEDLSAKGYSIRGKLLNKEMVVSGLTALARLHASSLLAEKRLGKSLKSMYPYAFVENSFALTGRTRLWYDVSVNAIVAIVKHLGHDAATIPKLCDEVFLGLEMSPTKRNVVSHGDLWGNNLMFSDDVPPKCVLVDFQLMRYCPLAHDVAQFLYLCTDRSFRKSWEEIMLKHYYNVLRETLSSASSISIEIPPWSEIVQGMEEQRLSALITAAIFFQTVLMSEDLGAHVVNDPVVYHEYEFQNRDKFVIETMKNDPTYGERITDAVEELVELGSRLDDLPKPS